MSVQFQCRYIKCSDCNTFTYERLGGHSRPVSPGTPTVLEGRLSPDLSQFFRIHVSGEGLTIAINFPQGVFVQKLNQDGDFTIILHPPKSDGTVERPEVISKQHGCRTAERELQADSPESDGFFRGRERSKSFG